MQLTEHWSLEELCHSNKAESLNLLNVPDIDSAKNLEALAINILEPLRVWYGKPIKSNCGYRSPKVNKAVGGAKTSRHLYGEASDLDTTNDNRKLFDYIRLHLPFDQCIAEGGTLENPAWVHVSYSRTHNRGEVWTKIAGETKYSPLKA